MPILVSLNSMCKDHKYLHVLVLKYKTQCRKVKKIHSTQTFYTGREEIKSASSIVLKATVTRYRNK